MTSAALAHLRSGAYWTRLLAGDRRRGPRRAAEVAPRAPSEGVMLARLEHQHAHPGHDGYQPRRAAILDRVVRADADGGLARGPKS